MKLKGVKIQFRGWEAGDSEALLQVWKILVIYAAAKGGGVQKLMCLVVQFKGC